MPLTTRAPGNRYSLALNAASTVAVLFGFRVISGLVLPENLAEAGHYQFLTNISAVCTVVYYLSTIASHVLGLDGLFFAKNNYVLPVVLALEFVVSGVYWLLRLLSAELILEKEVPFSLDFCLHIVPFVSLAADYFAFVPAVQTPNRVEFAICALLTNAYWLWLRILVDPARGQAYPYPFLNVPSEGQRAAIFLFVGSLAFGGFALLRKVQEGLVGARAPQPKKDI